MLSNLTRFYFVLDQEEYDSPIPWDNSNTPQAFEDVDTAVADCYEEQLKESNIDYIRFDL